nr:S41 family peptidase [Octadecabacter sp.]
MGAGSGSAIWFKTVVKRLLNQLWIVIGAVVAAFVVSWFIYMPNAQERGVWRAQSGGSIITLNALQAKLYSETSVSCVEQIAFPAHMKLVEMAEGATVLVEGDTLILRVDGALDPTPYTRIDALPATCGPVRDTTPREVFDAMWAAMDEHYAFFDVHGVDWSARRALAPAPGAQMTDNALKALLLRALEGLDDGHVHFGSYQIGYESPSRAPDWFPTDNSFDRDGLVQIARNTLGVTLTPVDQTAIEYALLPDGVGYVMIREIGVDTPFGSTDFKAMSLAFAGVANALQDAKAIIIDLRYNPGGSDTVSFAIASHFTAQPVDVLTKTTRDGDS